MVELAQLVSAPDCGSGDQGFESLIPPFLSVEFSADNLAKCTEGNSLVHGERPHAKRARNA